MRPAYKNLNLIGCRPVIAGWMGNDRHFLKMLFDVWVQARNTTSINDSE